MTGRKAQQAKRHAGRRRRPSPKKGGTRVIARGGGLTVSEVAELKQLRKELERASRQSPVRWNADPEDVRRSVARLVLTLVEFVRKLLERQAIRRMEAGTLTDVEVENIGRALMQLEETIRDIASQFGVTPDELNLDLGPIGRLM